MARDWQKWANSGLCGGAPIATTKGATVDDVRRGAGVSSRASTADNI